MTDEERARAEAIIQGENFAIYGEHRSGKSTLASQFPAPVFLAGEPGIKYLDIDEKAKKYIFSMREAHDSVETLVRSEHPYKTVVIDTVDSFSNMATEETCTKYNVASLMETDRKKGYDEVRKELWRMIHPLAMSQKITLVMLFHLKTVELKPKFKESFHRYNINFTDKSKELLFTYPHHIMMAYMNDDRERRLRVGADKYSESGSWNPNVESKQDIPLSYEAILEATL